MTKRQKLGFTIVELLVVIIVIGILTAIVVISYTGISQAAVASSLQSDLKNASTQLKLFQVDNSFYPALINDCPIPTTGNICLKASSSTTYQYFYNDNTNPQYFCVNAINGTTKYRKTNNSSVELGDCLDYGQVLSLDAGNPTSYPGTGTTWTDLSSNGNNGTLFNGVGYTSDSGGALTYDGVNDYAIISNNNLIENPKELTISSWFKKTNSSSDFNCVLHKSTNYTIGASEYWLGVESTGNRLTATIGARVPGIGWDAGRTSINATLGAWWNLVATWEGSIVKVYVNGIFNKQYALTSYSNISFPTRIGSSTNGDNYRFPGNIATIHIYDRALSATEITQNFNNLRGRYGI